MFLLLLLLEDQEPDFPSRLTPWASTVFSKVATYWGSEKWIHISSAIYSWESNHTETATAVLFVVQLPLSASEWFLSLDTIYIQIPKLLKSFAPTGFAQEMNLSNPLDLQEDLPATLANSFENEAVIPGNFE